jgi:hypothetical protein
MTDNLEDDMTRDKADPAHAARVAWEQLQAETKSPYALFLAQRAVLQDRIGNAETTNQRQAAQRALSRFDVAFLASSRMQLTGTRLGNFAVTVEDAVNSLPQWLVMAGAADIAGKCREVLATMTVDEQSTIRMSLLLARRVMEAVCSAVLDAEPSVNATTAAMQELTEALTRSGQAQAERHAEVMRFEDAQRVYFPPQAAE